MLRELIGEIQVEEIELELVFIRDIVCNGLFLGGKFVMCGSEIFRCCWWSMNVDVVYVGLNFFCKVGQSSYGGM